MTVSLILTKKGRVVATAAPDVTLQEAAKTLAEKRIGALVITHSDGAIAGILSERDVVRAVASKGAAALNDPASGHMTQKVVTTSEDKTIISVLEEMSARRFRHMPVTSGGRLIGILSIGDIVNHRLQEMEAEQAALKDYIAG
ncbi:MAG: CBS domain-containing protein [Rhodoblastus sp.]|nr:MAG: CBS domain-containing protein [Rhodoblastus sp.]